MEKELNIAAILKEKPQNTKLWSPVFGDVYLKGLDDDFYNSKIRITHHGTDNTFLYNGKVWTDGDICLFPSRWMNDWSKFAWKKGDVLICGFDNLCIFDKWCNEEYTEFEAKFVSPDYGGAVLKTHNCRKALNESTIKQHIAKIEEIKGGKLNLETLTIEHPKQEFKDGDILYMNGCRIIYILKERAQKSTATFYYISLDSDDFRLHYNNAVDDIHGSRLATDSEKQQLFSALAKENKRWNPETKQIEDLPKKCEFKPMGWCLMRDIDEVEYHNAITSEWALCQFSHYIDDYKIVAVGGNWHSQCIPYNEETKHLLGTRDEWEGGKG